MQMGVAKLGQVGGRATIAQLDDLAGAAAQQGLSGTAATSQVAKTFAAQEIKQSTVGQFTAPLDLARAGYKKLKGPRGAAAAPRAGAPEPAPPPTARPDVEAAPRAVTPEPAPPRAELQEPAAPKAETPQPSRRLGADPDADTRAKSAAKEGQALDQSEIDAEVRAVETSPRRAVADPELRAQGYVEEVPLDNGHTWRRHRDGYWCRFTKPKRTICTVATTNGTPNAKTTQPVKDASDGSKTSEEVSSETPPKETKEEATGTLEQEAPPLPKQAPPSTPAPKPASRPYKKLSDTELEAVIRSNDKGTEVGNQARYERYLREGGKLKYDDWFSISRGGRGGGPEHQEIQDRLGAETKYGTAETEKTIGGRGADAYWPKGPNGKPVVHQIGGRNPVRGDPISRERAAIEDIREVLGDSVEIWFWDKTNPKALQPSLIDPDLKPDWVKAGQGD
jgi:hypothetical protein